MQSDVDDEKTSRCRLKMDEEIERTPSRLRIGDVDVIHRGGFTLVGGQRKQGKSQALSIMTSVMMSGRSFGPLSVGELRTQRCAWFDTEQSPYFQKRNILRMYNLAGIEGCPDTSVLGLDYYGVSGLSAEKKLYLIGSACDYCDLVIIDQLADLLDDFNSLGESMKLIRWLMYSFHYNRNLSIIVVLHDNPLSSKARGHLGTLAEQKTTEKFTARCDENGIFTVEHTFSRDRQASPFQFAFDDNGFLVPVDSSSVNLGKVDPFKIYCRECGITFSQALSNFMGVVGISSSKRADARVVLTDLQHGWMERGIVVQEGKLFRLR